MIAVEVVDVVVVELLVVGTDDVVNADPFVDADNAEDSVKLSFELRFLIDSLSFLLSPLFSLLPLITAYDPSIYAGGSSGDFLFSDVLDTSDGDESSGKR